MECLIVYSQDRRQQDLVYPPSGSGEEILFNAQARAALRRGVDAVADAVKITLGAVCQNVLVSNPPVGPVVTNDGVSIARAIELPGAYENMGAQLIVEAATEASRWAGDGTTTATVLAQGMLTQGLQNVAAGANPMMLRRGIELAVTCLSEELAKLAHPASTRSTLAKVGEVAANHSRLGFLAAEATLATQPDGGVTVGEGSGLESTIRHSAGISWGRGFISSAFVNSAENRVELDHPYILITDRKLNDFESMRPLFQLLSTAGIKSLFVICDGAEGEALAAFVSAKTGGNMNIALVRAPALGRRRSEICEDLALATDAHFVSAALDQDWATVTLDTFGRADAITVTATDFTIVGPQGRPDRIEARLASLRDEAQRVTKGFNATRLADRARRLAGNMAVLEIAAPTAVERKELRQRATNAIYSCQAAYKDGVLPGGGSAFLRARAALDALDVAGDIAVGVDIVRRSVVYPLAQIVNNAGGNGQQAVEELGEIDDPSIGFNALTRKYENLIEAGILDPLAVIQSSLRSAAGAAIEILTTETAVKYIPEQRDTVAQAETEKDHSLSRTHYQTTILFGEHGRDALRRGANTLAEVVKTTHGPRGLNVMIARNSLTGARTPAVSRDGAAVAREIQLPHAAENMGAQLLREATLQTDVLVGDGTTTAAVLAQAILQKAHLQVAVGRNPMSLRRGLQLAATYVDSFIHDKAQSIANYREIEWIARVSSGESHIASAVATAFDRVGAIGAVEVNEDTGLDITCSFVAGLRIDSGLLSPFFVTDHVYARTLLENPLVLVLSGTNTGLEEFVSLIDHIGDTGGQSLFVIANHFSEEMLRFLAANWLKGPVKVCPVRAPYSGSFSHEILVDVATATEAQPISLDTGLVITPETLNVLGGAKRVIVGVDNATIVEGRSGHVGLTQRRGHLDGQLASEKDSRTREMLNHRILHLSGNVASINVGAATQVEMRNRLERTEDAVRAVRAALEGGVVPGGGTAYLHAAASLPEYPDENDITVGISILREALIEPFRSIVANSGSDPGEILAKVRALPFGHGYDVIKGECVDLVATGIMDPAKVTSQALRSAVSVAISLITTDTVVAPVAEASAGTVEVDVLTYTRMLSDDPTTDWDY